MPSDFALKTMNSLHRGLLKVSGGRLGRTAGGMPVLAVTTTGRKTGRSHTVMLTSPVQTPSAYVIVASRGGDDQHPAWFLNLRANPDVEVAIEGGPTQRRRARVATSEERAELWPEVTAKYRNYAKYQTKTAREIPLVLLEPPA